MKDAIESVRIAVYDRNATYRTDTDLRLPNKVETYCSITLAGSRSKDVFELGNAREPACRDSGLTDKEVSSMITSLCLHTTEKMYNEHC